MKKYLPFFIGVSILFNLLFAVSIFLNGFYILKYDNPFGETDLDKEIGYTSKTIFNSTELLETIINDNNNAIAPILDKRNPSLKKAYKFAFKKWMIFLVL